PRFRGLSQSLGQVTHVLLTRSPLEYPRRSLSARLACVKHAASVRPEPGSNSPTKTYVEKRPGNKINSLPNKPRRGFKNNTAIWHWLLQHPVEISKNKHTSRIRTSVRVREVEVLLPYPLSGAAPNRCRPGT